jgi:hypothetical protein
VDTNATDQKRRDSEAFALAAGHREYYQQACLAVIKMRLFLMKVTVLMELHGGLISAQETGRYSQGNIDSHLSRAFSKTPRNPANVLNTEFLQQEPITPRRPLITAITKIVGKWLESMTDGQLIRRYSESIEMSIGIDWLSVPSIVFQAVVSGRTKYHQQAFQKKFPLRIVSSAG